MIRSEHMTSKIDELDRKILYELSKNSRESFRQIARRLGVSIATVINRVKRLEEDGIIKGYTVSIDAEKLGYDLTAVIEVSVSKGKLAEVENEIAKKANVISVYDITGQTDVIVIARFRNRKELNSFVKALLSMEFVEHTNTRVVLSTVKEDLSLPYIYKS